MRSYRWLIITVAAVIGLIALAIAVGALWLNSFIHSEAFKTEVASRVAQAVGGPVQIQSIDFDIFHGVKLQGLVTQIDPSHAGGQGALIVNIASVNCSYDLSNLLGGKLSVTGVTLDQPQIVLTKQDTPSAPTPSPSSGSKRATSTGAGTAMPFQVVLNRVKVSDGRLSVLDAEGTSMAEFQGVNASADTSGYFAGKDVTGTLKIADMQGSHLHITGFSTPFTYHANLLDAQPFEASAFDGTIAGSYHFDGMGPSTLEVNAKGFDVAQIAVAANSGSSARLTGSLDLQSKWLGAESGDANGEGDAQLTNGKLTGVKMLHDLSEVFRVKELDEPVISSAKTHFVVQNQQTKFIGLQLNSTGFQMTGSGVIGFDGGLNADMVLILSSGAMGKLPKQAASFFVQQSDGSGSVAFHLSGTVTNPQTDLATRLLMQNIQLQNSVKKALNKFFH